MSEINSIKTSGQGIEYIDKDLKIKQTVITKAFLWGIHHRNSDRSTMLKIGRYKKSYSKNIVDVDNPKSELTLENDELDSLCEFLNENYEPFKLGVKSYLPVGGDLEKTLAALISSNDKGNIIGLLSDIDILSDELFLGVQVAKRVHALSEFEEMLMQDCKEEVWQKWFEKSSWILGTDFVEILEDRRIDTHNIADYLMKAFDGFLDIIEIKRTSSDMSFWNIQLDHNNYLPSQQLIKAITQSLNYLYEIEREANSIKTQERLGGTKIIKPRCILIYGRSNDWNEDQFKAYRILNANYTSLTIMTYDQVLNRAKHILGVA